MLTLMFVHLAVLEKLRQTHRQNYALYASSKYFTKILKAVNMIALCKSSSFDKDTTSSTKSYSNSILLAAAIFGAMSRREISVEYADFSL